MSDNVFIDVVEPIDYHVLAPSEKELERWWARQNRQGRGAGAFDANSIGTSGSDSDASDCGGMTMREAQQLVNKRRAEYPGRLDERFASGMRVKTKLAPSSPLATIPSSPTIHRNRADSSSSGEGEGLAGPSPRSPLDRAAARDARLEPNAASGGSPKADPRPATVALLTPAVSSDNLPSSPSQRTRLHHHHHHHPSPGVIDELAPVAACAPPDDATSGRYVDIEAGVREIIAREEVTKTKTTGGAGGWTTTRRIAKRFADRRIPAPVWAALGVLWLYAIARLVLGA